MAIVLEFPKKKELPRKLEKRLHKVAKEYISVIYDALETLGGNEATQQDFDEIHELIVVTYAKELGDVIDALEEP